MARILVTEPVDEAALARLAGHEVVRGWELPAAAAAPALAAAAAVIVRTAPLGAAALATAPGLRVIAKHGVGVDNIPLAVARDRGIWVANTPGANSQSVAEHTLMLILALARGLAAGGGAVELAGRRALVVGYGRVGRRVAGLAAALGLRVQVLAPGLAPPVTAEGHAVAPGLRPALAEADVLTLHCPLTAATRGMIGAAELALLPPGAFVVNTARGGLVDEEALAAAALAGRLGGIGLDVFASEPLAPASPLRRVANAVLTPHLGATSAEAFRRMGEEAVRNVLDALAGRLRPEVVVVAGRDPGPAGRETG
ncbi:MAG: hypothetical protein IT545_06960 [Rhodobacteraceae bacterium]|nr:hypothetical protein [Paracoccaceae bacterium]